MKTLILNFYKLIARIIINAIVNHEQIKKPFPELNEREIEYYYSLSMIIWHRNKNNPKILDIGTGNSSWPHILSICGHNVKAIDEKGGYWRNIFFNRHYKVYKENILYPKRLKEKFDIITCISTIEHIEQHDLVIKNCYDLLNDSGLLILTFPYDSKTYHKNVSKSEKHITQVFNQKTIYRWMIDNDFKLINQRFYSCFNGVWNRGEKFRCIESKHEFSNLTCLTLKK